MLTHTSSTLTTTTFTTITTSTTTSTTTTTISTTSTTTTTTTTTLWSSELFDHRGGLHSDKTECNEEPAGDASTGGEEDHIHR